MQDIYVVGVGMTPFGKFRDKTIKAMTGEAVAAAHRREAFLAADYLMDRLKTEAAFWKREEGPDGGVWIEPTDHDRADLARWSA